MKEKHKDIAFFGIIFLIFIGIIAFPIIFSNKDRSYTTINLNKFEDWKHIERHQYTKLSKKENHLLLIDNNYFLYAFAKNDFEDVSIGELVVNLKSEKYREGYFFLDLKDSNGELIFRIFRNNYGDYYFFQKELKMFLFDDNNEWNSFNISFDCNKGKYNFLLNGNEMVKERDFDANEISFIELKTHKRTFQSKTEIEFEIFKKFE